MRRVVLLYSRSVDIGDGRRAIDGREGSKRTRWVGGWRWGRGGIRTTEERIDHSKKAVGEAAVIQRREKDAGVKSTRRGLGREKRRGRIGNHAQ